MIGSVSFVWNKILQWLVFLSKFKFISTIFYLPSYSVVCGDITYTCSKVRPMQNFLVYLRHIIFISVFNIFLEILTAVTLHVDHFSTIFFCAEAASAVCLDFPNFCFDIIVANAVVLNGHDKSFHLSFHSPPPAYRNPWFFVCDSDWRLNSPRNISIAQFPFFVPHYSPVSHLFYLLLRYFDRI